MFDVIRTANSNQWVYARTTQEKKMDNKVTVVSPIAHIRFPNLLEHESYGGVTTGKYSLTMVMDPNDVKGIEEAIVSAGGGKGKSPLKSIDADAEYDAGMVQLKAKTTFPVKAVDASGSFVPLESVTHGSEARVKLTFQRYEQQGGGVTCYLGNIQLLSSGGTGDLDFGELPSGYEPGTDEDSLPF